MRIVRFQENYKLYRRHHDTTTHPTTTSPTISKINQVQEFLVTVQYPARARAGTVQYSSTVQSRDYVIIQ